MHSSEFIDRMTKEEKGMVKQVVEKDVDDEINSIYRLHGTGSRTDGCIYVSKINSHTQPSILVPVLHGSSEQLYTNDDAMAKYVCGVRSR